MNDANRTDTGAGGPRASAGSAPGLPGPFRSRVAPPHHLLSATLSGLPELGHFPTDEARQAALSQLGAEAGSRDFLDLVKGIVAVAGSAVMVVFVARLAARGLSWPRWVVDLIAMVAAAAVVWGVLRFLHRRGFQRGLRGKLIESSVAICRTCGYLLHGLATRERCPECGRAFEADVRALLDREARGAERLRMDASATGAE